MPRTPGLETAVMRVLWDADGWLRAREVLQRLAPAREITYSTTATVLGRLHRKGRVERRPVGRAYEYHPVRDREAEAAVRMRRALETAGDRSMALAQFIEALPDDERLELGQRLASE
jgi:predicted transcriptional regulator